MAFIRKIKKKSGTYLAKVESYRIDGKVRQRVIEYLGKEIDGKAEKRVLASEIKVDNVKRSFDVLAVDTIARELGITTLANKHLLALIYSQVLEKRSINQLEEWLRFTEIPDVLGIEKVSTKSLYESFGDIDENEMSAINEKLYDLFKKCDKSCDVAVIDVTDTYFEGSHEDIKRRKGKDGKVRKLLQIGLAVSFEHGFPLFYKKYHGNLNNVPIFKDMVLELQSRNLTGVIVDRGMTSQENIQLAKTLKLNIIAGLRKNKQIADEILSTIPRQEIFSLKHRIRLKNSSVFAMSFPFCEGTLIAVYNPMIEFVKKEHVFEKGEELVNPHIGYSLIYHNTSYDVAKVVKQYYDKEIVERAFKQLKGILNLRPVRVWLQEHVEGHIAICYLAYAILAFMNFKLQKLEITSVNALTSLKSGYKVSLSAGNTEWDVHVPLEPKQKNILKTIGVVYKK